MQGIVITHSEGFAALHHGTVDADALDHGGLDGLPVAPCNLRGRLAVGRNRTYTETVVLYLGIRESTYHVVCPRGGDTVELRLTAFSLAVDLEIPGVDVVVIDGQRSVGLCLKGLAIPDNLIGNGVEGALQEFRAADAWFDGGIGLVGDNGKFAQQHMVIGRSVVERNTDQRHVALHTGRSGSGGEGVPCTAFCTGKFGIMEFLLGTYERPEQACM